ncbi:MAG: radical SAM protein [Clostridia bacterium]|nr:radical SAM protein [Clostridia bacterium]
MSKLYKNIIIELSGICNGKCTWCTTGMANRKGLKPSGGYMCASKFIELMQYLQSNKIIDDNSNLYLYNWGEPLLNPEVKEIIKHLNKSGIHFILSTNASKPVLFDGSNDLKTLKELRFSMPGFSQESYNRIHGFDFNTIKNNISSILENYRNCGFQGDASIYYHVYQFNVRELEKAYEFSARERINIYPYYAYLNDYKTFKEYLASTMQYDQLKKASQELFLFYIDQELKDMPDEYTCNQMDEFLVIDENCELLTCCVIDKENEYYSLGSIFNYSLSEVENLKRSQPICEECKKYGVIYLIQSILSEKLNHFENGYTRYLKENDFCCQSINSVQSRFDREVQRRIEADIIRLRNEIQYLMERSREKQINYLIWGAGNGGELAKYFITSVLPNFNLVGYIDKFKLGELNRIPIFKPQVLGELNFDYIIIATTPGKSEANQKLVDLGLRRVKDFIEIIF